MKVKWYQLKNLASKGFNGIRNRPGIYVLRWAQGGKPVCVSRLVGSDEKGILYIGKAKKLRERVLKLWRSLKGLQIGKIPPHTAGKTVIFCKLFEIISLCDYEIAFEEVQTNDDAKGQEWEAIRLYAKKYREPPPLNLMLFREYFALAGIATSGKSRVTYEPDEFVKSIIDENR